MPQPIEQFVFMQVHGGDKSLPNELDGRYLADPKGFVRRCLDATHIAGMRFFMAHCPGGVYDGIGYVADQLDILLHEDVSPLVFQYYSTERFSFDCAARGIEPMVYIGESWYGDLFRAKEKGEQASLIGEFESAKFKRNILAWRFFGVSRMFFDATTSRTETPEGRKRVLRLFEHLREKGFSVGSEPVPVSRVGGWHVDEERSEICPTVTMEAALKRFSDSDLFVCPKGSRHYVVMRKNEAKIATIAKRIKQRFIPVPTTDVPVSTMRTMRRMVEDASL